MTHILIADDDSDVRETLQLLFEEAGYATLAAEDGHQALDLIQHSSYPLIALLDISLPQVDGLSILRTVASQHEPMAGHKRAYILMTGHAPALYMPYIALLTQLNVPVIPKPFDIDYPLTVVAEAAARL
jgi:CheY-like chemotaxis protein